MIHDENLPVWNVRIDLEPVEFGNAEHLIVFREPVRRPRAAAVLDRVHAAMRSTRLGDAEVREGAVVLDNATGDATLIPLDRILAVHLIHEGA